MASVSRAMMHKLPVVGLAFSPDGKALLTGCSNDFSTAGEVCLWDASSGQPLVPPRTFSHGVHAIAFRPDGQAVAVASGPIQSEDGDVSLWHLTTPASGGVEQLRLRFQTWTGMELRETADYRQLTPEEWLQRKRELEDIEKGP